MALQQHVRDPPHRPDVLLTSPTAAARGEVNMADHLAVGLVVRDAVRAAANRWPLTDPQL